MASKENTREAVRSQSTPTPIPVLFAEWLPLHNIDLGRLADGEQQRALRRLHKLREEIVSHDPITAKDMAMQIVAHTNNFEFEPEEEFISRVASIATRIDVFNGARGGIA